MALDHEGHEVYGEVNIDQLDNVPQELMLTPPVPATREAVEAIAEADLILIGPGSFYTSLLPILLLDEMAQALRRTPAPMVFIDNLGKEHSPAARLSLAERIAIMERYVGKRVVDAVIAGPKADISGIDDRRWRPATFPIVMTGRCSAGRWRKRSSCRADPARRRRPSSAHLKILRLS